HLPHTNTAPTRLHTLSLHDALPISRPLQCPPRRGIQSRHEFPAIRTFTTARPDQRDPGIVLGWRRHPSRQWLAQHLRERKYRGRSEEHTSELQSRFDLVCRLLLEKK